LRDTFHVSSMNGAAVNELYVDLELPNAPVHVEQYPSKKSATGFPENCPLKAKVPRGGTSVRCSNCRHCACTPNRKWWLPDTLLVAFEMLKMFSVAPCVMPPSPLLV
jgi:hypothetical protein